MKRLLMLCLCALMALVPLSALADEGGPAALLSGDSTTFSYPLALALLEIASLQDRQATADYLNENGWQVLLQRYYDKLAADGSHTSAFTLASRRAAVNGTERDIFLIAIRGTSAGEWYANFDFAPSQSDDAALAENFFFAAQDIFEAVAPYIEQVESPLVLATDYSRGAACANLLGVLLDTVYPARDVFVYTFATPNTVRGDYTAAPFKNIFNIVNPLDIVPRMPLAAWGYSRAGVDVTLKATKSGVLKVDSGMEILYRLAPTVSAYYQTRHSLTAPGEGADGLTAYEFMLYVAQGLTGLSTSRSLTLGGETGSLIGESTDFSELLALFDQLNGNGGGERILSRHMPATYLDLLERGLE